MRIKAVILLLLCAVLRTAAQRITYVDWNVLRADTVPTFYEEVIPLGADYAGYDYEVRLEYPEYVPLTAAEAARVSLWADSLPEHPKVEWSVQVSRKQGMLDVYFNPFVRREGRLCKLTSFAMKIATTPKSRTRAAAGAATRAAAGRYAANSVLAQGRWVKIGITADGVYRLTAADLQRMGFSDVSRVKLYGYGGHVQEERISADTDFDDLEEVPLYRDGRGVLFYGKGLVSWSAPNANGVATHRTNTYANQACYFLTEGDNPMSIQTVTASATPVRTLTSAPSHVLYKKEAYSWMESGRTFYENVNYAQYPSNTYSLPVVDLVAGTGNARLTVSFAAKSSSDTQVGVAVNGSSAGSVSISKVSSEYQRAMTGTWTFIVGGLLGKGVSDVSVTLNHSGEGRLSYLALSYVRRLRMTEAWQYIRCNGSQAGRLQIDMNGRSDVRLWRLGRRGEPMVQMAGAASGGMYSADVDDVGREYVAVDVNAEFPVPVQVGEVDNQNLHAFGAVDMVIVIPASGKLYEQAERLAEAHRSMDGLRVAVVRADQIYNEFSSGTPDATAIRRFMKMLYDRAETEADMPRYLLLFGDGVWDNRMLTASTRGLNPDDYLLCYESEGSLSATSSYVMEEYYGLLDDGEGQNLLTDKPDLGVGRFPVVTAADAAVMVDKTLAHMEKRNAGSWRNVICVLGDDGDANQHLDMAENIAQLIEEEHPEMQVNRIYWDAYKRESSTTANTYPGVEADIARQMKEGCLMMNYAGHGAPRVLSAELAIQIEDIASWTSPKVPLWVTAACDVAPFDMREESIGKSAVLQPNGAAVAFLGTARTVYATYNERLNLRFTRHVLGCDETGRRHALGDALRLAKVELVSGSPMLDGTANKFHFVLLGDPALKLGKPEYRIVVDEINGQPVDGAATAQFRAGSTATVSGHVCDDTDARLTDYTGVLDFTVYDSESTVTCLNNNGSADTSFVFNTRDKRLYTGRDSVRNGAFELRFTVPMDIKYSGESGRVVLYAVDNGLAREANGYTEEVLVGGSSEELSGDTEGPWITAWLNREDFQWGGTVNPTPYFMARLEDESGINVTGTAVGHDLELCIDGDPAKTYILNDYYQNDFGKFRSGQVAFPIPALEDGVHTLMFRAWDVLNHSSKVELEFRVDSRQAPDLISLSATQNPAREQTTFIVCYDRPETACVFGLEVFDFAGRKLWQHAEQGTSETGVYHIPWNLTTSSGMPLSTGVYLYRVTLMEGRSKRVSKTNKLVILRNK